MTYILLKSLHLCSVFIFFSGLMALAVVTSSSAKSSFVVCLHDTGVSRTVLVWDRYVTTPAMLGAWVFGLSLVATGGWMGQAWLTGKISIVIALSGFHGVLRGKLKRRIDGSALSHPPWLKHAPLYVVAGLVIIVSCLTMRYF